MSTRRFVSLGVAAAILAAALPAAAEPGSPDVRLRASIDRALSAPAPAAVSPSGPQAKPSSTRRSAQSGATSNGGGGGGGGRMILAILGTALSVGATIYMVKEMKKTNEPPTPAFR